MRPLLVLEDTTRPRRRLFTAMGVEWWATRWAWVGPLFWVTLGCVVAWAEGAVGGTGAAGSAPSGAAAAEATKGVAYGLLLWLTNAVHTLGHVAASRMAGTPMDAVVITSTRDVTVYRGAKREVPEGIRVIRSMGGPLANALLALAALAGAAAISGSAGGFSPWLRMFGVFNLCVAAWTLSPVPTMDGWVVWRWVFRRRPRLTPP